MLDTDQLVRENAEHLLPIAESAAPDWNDVLARGGQSHAGTRRVLLVAALSGAAALLATLAFTPAGSAITSGWENFSAWVSGTPGQEASPREQRAFENDKRSWSAFPSSPKLRRLIVTEVDGIEYRLFGYRIGSSFCLRLLSDASPADSPTACAPATELERTDAPALVLLADYGLAAAADSRPDTPGAQATFGITTDAVNGVTVAEARGRAQIESRVAGNAFLIVAAQPERGYRIKSLSARTTSSRVAISLAEAPFDRRDVAGESAGAIGPTALERHLDGGTVGWVERGEPRGKSIAGAGLPADSLQRLEPSFARIVQPDPQSMLRVGVALGTSELLGASEEQPDLCVSLVAREHFGGGCSPLEGFFAPGPISFSQSLLNGGDQYVGVGGMVSDHVSRLELFLATGERIAVPLRDNTFVASPARTKYPAKLVAYDSAGKVVGISTLVDPISG